MREFDVLKGVGLDQSWLWSIGKRRKEIKKIKWRGKGEEADEKQRGTRIKLMQIHWWY